MPNDNEKREVTVSLSPKVLALLGLAKDAKTEAIQERLEHLDKNPKLYRKTAAGTVMAGFDVEWEDATARAHVGIFPKGKADFVDLSFIEVPSREVGPDPDKEYHTIHFYLYEDPYQDEPTHHSSMLMEDLREATKDFEDDPEKEVSVGRWSSYDPKNSLLTMTIEDYHVMSVSYNERLQRPQAHMESIGGHQIELDLSGKGTKATLRGQMGETTINIRSPRPDGDVLLHANKNTLVVGSICNNVFTGKLALKKYLEEEHPKDDVIGHRLESMLQSIAEKQKIVLPKPDIRKEMEDIMKLKNFTYGKRYSFLYEAGIQPACHTKAKQFTR